MSENALLNVAVKRSGQVLLTVGGYGVPRKVSMAELISLTYRRSKTSSNTNRKHNNN